MYSPSPTSPFTPFVAERTILQAADVDFEAEEKVDNNHFPTDRTQNHQLWWDADSAILNSRARHTVKVPGGMLGSVPGVITSSTNDDDATTIKDPSLLRLLDCIFGEGDIHFSLFWSIGSADTGEARTSDRKPCKGEGRQERRRLGTAVLRRSDLAPLVKKTSSRAVLRLAIQPCRPADGGGSTEGEQSGASRSFGCRFSAPGTLPLSVSYRREPSAVARRKSRGGNGRRETANGVPHKLQHKRHHVGHDSSTDNHGNRGEMHARRASTMMTTLSFGEEKELEKAAEDDEHDLHPSEIGAKRSFGEIKEEGDIGRRQAPGRDNESRRRERADRRADEDVMHYLDLRGDSDGTGGADTLVHRSSRTEHLLPARTTVCVCVDGIELPHASLENVDALAGDGESLVWASFRFPGTEDWDRGSGGGSVGEGGGNGNRLDEDERWSPAVSVQRESTRDWAPLEWSVEVNDVDILYGDKLCDSGV